MKRWLPLVAIGLIGGVLSGLFGVGGGIVMVPLLVTFAGFDHRRAAATSLAAIVPTAVAGSIGYAVGGRIDLLAALLIGIGGVGGSLLGTRLLRRLPIAWLRWLFLALLAVVAVRMLVEQPSRDGDFHVTWLTGAALVLLGIAMGVASGLFGIGGGVLVVPALVALFGVSDLEAKGTSLAAMILTALSGTFFNWRARLVAPLDGAVLGVCAVVASFAGVSLAFLLPDRLAAVLFVVLIVVSAVQLVIAGVREHRARRAA